MVAKYKFSSAERFAVFTTHGDRCYMCRSPIDMASFQIDHLIPESLLAKPDQLAKVLRELGRKDTFDVNDVVRN